MISRCRQYRNVGGIRISPKLGSKNSHGARKKNNSERLPYFDRPRFFCIVDMNFFYRNRLKIEILFISKEQI